jgi:DNA polymerase-3 subunit beta
MQFELSAKEFASLVKCASAVISTRNVIPILEHALFSGDGETLSVSATCIDQTITSSVPCAAKGGFTASVSRLSAIAGTLDKSQPVKISFNAPNIIISQGRSTDRLPSLCIDDFPVGLTGPLDGVRAEWEAPAPVLSRTLTTLAAFADTAKGRIYLAGIYFDTQAQTLVATNGQVLARDEADWCKSKTPGFIIPVAAVKAISDLIGGTDVVRIKANDRAASFECDGGRLRTAMVDGQFPDYLTILKALNSTTKARVNRAALLSAIMRVSSVGFDPSGGTSIRVTVSGKEICVDALGENENQSVDYCAAEIKGKAVELGASWRYLRLAFDTLEGAEEVEIALDGPASPLVVTPVGSKDFLRLVMPVALATSRKQAA